MTDDEFVTNVILLGFQRNPTYHNYRKNQNFYSIDHGLNIELVNEWDDDYRVVRIYIQSKTHTNSSNLHVSMTTLETGLEEIIKYIASLREVTSPQ